MSDDEHTRVGTAEREEALTALADHFDAGRLDSDEYEDRRGRARDAVVQNDLEALFTDLPGGKPTSGAATEVSAQQSESVVTPVNRDERESQPRRGRTNGIRGSRGGRNNYRTGLVALTPFVALVLFFITNNWLWFLLVPVAGIVFGVFGQGDDD